MAISTGLKPSLLRLPAELRTIIWGYVIADCRPAIGPAVRDTLGSNVRRVVSFDDKKGTYSPHPLCYVCKSISNEVREQIYETAVFTTIIFFYWLDTRTLPQIKHLSLTMIQAFYMLNADFPFINSASIRPKKELVLSNVPGLKYLELEWGSDIPPLTCTEAGRLMTYRRILARLHFFRRPFQVDIKVLASRMRPDPVVRIGLITGPSASLTFEYEDGFAKDSHLEQRFTHFICTGDSREEKGELHSFVTYLNCCRLGRRSISLGNRNHKWCCAFGPKCHQFCMLDD